MVAVEVSMEDVCIGRGQRGAEIDASGRKSDRGLKSSVSLPMLS
jgi:hypothetical protein